jgi:regulator of protease activity HflC (stomatin/prohibitin superfamily)
MERGSRQTRISGPAVFTSELFEYVKRIYNLQEKQETFTFKDVLTNDFMATKVEISVVYGIRVSDAARRGETPLIQAEIEHLQYIDSRMPDWERAIKAAIEGSVRRVIATKNFADLLTNGRLLELEQQIYQDLNSHRIRAWGIRVDEVTIQSVQPTQEVINERARAEAWRGALLLIADGYRNAIRAGMPEEAIHCEALRHTLEQIAKDPATKMIFTPELHDALNGLRLSAGMQP